MSEFSSQRSEANGRLDFDVMPDSEILVACGETEVFLFAAHPAQTEWDGKIWSWCAETSADLPASLRPAFRCTDDCKPIDGGHRLLVSSAGGGCACIETPSGRVIWHASVPDAHSLELLPDNRVIVASSSPRGNSLTLFDLDRSDDPLWQTDFCSASGVVWDVSRRRLWALGCEELRCYRLENWDTALPTLALESAAALPDENGRDLQAVPQSNDLVVATSANVYLFDRDGAGFRLHPNLRGREKVVCVSIHPRSERTLFVQANCGESWSTTLRLLAPVQTLELYGERLHRARWFAEN